ncbi:formylmethanofuran dehydrogenase subunit C [Oryzibacter oryziterrae]|uniref:formylmethanofuran dehydrogenase subunit C n=1 Tax=Oryzibacter oryziterrae TaxID=2766474 RepID=UPI001EFF95C2|nr:formylmethanofuran dehydrogenase subunit C [Oryzibacter oryziterrae]
MAALTFTLKAAPPERLDLSLLVPDKLKDLSAREIERLGIGTTPTGVVVGDLFTVSGTDLTDIRFAGGSDRFDGVGTGLKGASLHVDGDVGAYLGRGMKSGKIVVAGSLTGPYGATAATGGVIRVTGNAADATAASIPGAMAGLAGATLIIEGNAGDLLGDRLRRGVILVQGSVGALAGARMVGGTIISAALGRRAGQGMKRGTLIAGTVEDIEPTFVFSGSYTEAFLPLLRRWVASEAGAGFAALVPQVAQRYRGDMASLGKGEILIG